MPESTEETIEKDPETWSEILSDPWGRLTREFPNLAENQELTDLKAWYQDQLLKLPILKTEAVNIETKDWSTVYDIKGSEQSPGALREIKRADNQFFSIKGVRVTRTDPSSGKEISWNQPVIFGQETPLYIKFLSDKKIELPVYALLVVIQDDKGRSLLTVGQEAVAESERSAVIRLPIQASTSKIANTMEGNPKGDKSLLEVMRAFGCSNFSEFLDKAESTHLQNPEDPDRTKKHNIIIILPTVLSDSDLHKQLEAGGNRIWATKSQIDMIKVAALTNSHTISSIDLVESRKNLAGL